jgi:hypothetical protein
MTGLHATISPLPSLTFHKCIVTIIFIVGGKASLPAYAESKISGFRGGDYEEWHLLGC